MEWHRFNVIGLPEGAGVAAWAFDMFRRIEVSLKELPLSHNVTTAELVDATSPINTIKKTPGRQIYNTTTGLPLWASGGGATDTWDDATGTTQHTPS